MLQHTAVRRIAGAAFAGSVLSVLAVSAILSGLLAAPAAAADPRHLGTFKDWNAFAFEENGRKVCYMSSQPKKSDPAKAKRGDVYALVTHRPAEKTLDVVSIIVGYPFKKGSDGDVTIDGKAFKLFTDGETAWARDPETDRAVTAALRNGKQMVVKGVSGRGTKTTDTYSLEGVGQAYDAINEACGVKR